MLTCTLELHQAGQGAASLRFVLRNAGDERAVISYFQPFVDFDLAAESPDGPVGVVQPAFEIALRPVTQTIEPGETTPIETPIQVGFDPDVPPSGGENPKLWSLKHEPVSVRLSATARVGGAELPPCEALLDPAILE